MRFEKLRLTGFKSFVEATDFIIQPGLTGVVGPNGCGKSNLVEALRWVMGESSFKQMRAAGMDEVIFSGSGSRPARNSAEVGLVLDNSDRSAPAAFNNADLLEITRRIEREQGSVYRVNGKEVRARDVQLLFADASSGARSPAMVRQGQIGEIIAAKPQARRRILEEAAGIGGLHSRRHEAELRLKGAEENLVRLEDVLKQIEAQADGLRRQAKQAARYKHLAADIRRHEALIALISFRAASEQLALAERQLENDLSAVAERTRLQAETARHQALAAHALPGLREDEARANALLQRLVLAREQLDGEEKRAKERGVELERRIAQAAADLARERVLIEDAAGVIARLEEEDVELSDAGDFDADLAEEARQSLDAAEAALARSEAQLAQAQATLSDSNARRLSLVEAARGEQQRFERHEAELAKLADEIAAFQADASQEEELAALASEFERLSDDLVAAEETVLVAEDALAEARESEARLRTPLLDAERKAQQLETQARTLDRLLTSASGELWPPVVDEISVAKGYEAALGAALGEELEASTNVSAPAHWARVDGKGDPSLPPGVSPLSKLVQAPPALARALAQIGLVTRSEGAGLRALLKPGQRLVSKDGDLWRWDGFTQAAEAPTPAARRLAEKNKLGDLQIEASVAREAAENLRLQAEAAQTAVQNGAQAETRAREASRAAQKALEESRERAGAAERRHAQHAARLAALTDARVRLVELRDEAQASLVEANEALESLSEPATLMGELDVVRALNAQDRAKAVEARAALQGLTREADQRQRRREAIARERQSWFDRRARSDAQIEEIQARVDESQDELETLRDAPDTFLEQRRALMGQIDAADEARKQAGDRRSAAEIHLAEADRQARAALDAMSQAREIRARTQAQAEAARAQLGALVKAIAHDLGCEPAGLPALAGVKPDDGLPPAETVERKLENYKHDRERLGAVNLRADEELQAVEAQREKLAAEQRDLAEAIKKLRAAITSLNKEGRERLLSAFARVDAHFRELFTLLFGGGAAELQLVESEDPLEAGLEILAKPPGKKPQTMTLLSGGEQALTAMALIFAVFLTNPSPICVLDEVDAPLDDANVERFCDLLEDMRQKTDTRFITITHNPITMARMDRLFGVTQAERGVSQLVSVDLQQAERFLEAS